MEFEYNLLTSLSCLVLSIVLVIVSRKLLFKLPKLKATYDHNRQENHRKLKSKRDKYSGRLSSSNKIALATNVVFFIGILPFFVTFESQSIGTIALHSFLILMVYDFPYPFSYDPYEKMEKTISVTIRKIEENSLRLVTVKTNCNLL